jgi:hypothetical protein
MIEMITTIIGGFAALAGVIIAGTMILGWLDQH